MIKKALTAFGVFALVFVLSSTARAEWYVGGYGGLNMPGKLTNVEGRGTLASGALPGVTFGSVVKASDLELENSVTYGLKAGFFFPRWNMIGLEVDASTATPNIKQQSYTRTEHLVSGGTLIPIGPPTQAQLSSAKLRVTNVSLNLVFRIPGRFEPYAGGGVGLYRANFESSDPSVGKSSDTAVGLNLMAGARFFFTKRLAAFGEYKYNAANFDFADRVLFKGDYSAHVFVGGLSVHLK